MAQKKNYITLIKGDDCLEVYYEDHRIADIEEDGVIHFWEKEREEFPQEVLDEIDETAKEYIVE